MIILWNHTFRNIFFLKKKIYILLQWRCTLYHKWKRNEENGKEKWSQGWRNWRYTHMVNRLIARGLYWFVPAHGGKRTTQRFHRWVHFHELWDLHTPTPPNWDRSFVFLFQFFNGVFSWYFIILLFLFFVSIGRSWHWNRWESEICFPKLLHWSIFLFPLLLWFSHMIESHGLILSLMSRMLSHDIRLQEKQQIFFF